MTKETILKRLLLEDHITLDELIILAESPGKTFTIDFSVIPKKDKIDFLDLWQTPHYSTIFNTSYHQSPNIVSSKL